MTTVNPEPAPKESDEDVQAHSFEEQAKETVIVDPEESDPDAEALARDTSPTKMRH